MDQAPENTPEREHRKEVIWRILQHFHPGVDIDQAQLSLTKSNPALFPHYIAIGRALLTGQPFQYEGFIYPLQTVETAEQPVQTTTPTTVAPPTNAQVVDPNTAQVLDPNTGVMVAAPVPGTAPTPPATGVAPTPPVYKPTGV